MTISSYKDANPGGRLIHRVVAAAAERGMNQRALSLAAGVPQSSISRIKRTGRADLETLDKLARAAGLRLTLISDDDYTEKLSRGELF